MLPIVWFYIAAVLFLLVLLLYTELRNRARAHVKGCSSLLFISPARLNSLIIIEPDLKMLELGLHYGKVGIPDAQRIPVDQLESLVSHTSRSTILVFYDSIREPVNWKNKWNSSFVNTRCATPSCSREVSKRGRATSVPAPRMTLVPQPTGLSWLNLISLRNDSDMIAMGEVNICGCSRFTASQMLRHSIVFRCAICFQLNSRFRGDWRA